jgi:hypothetical protein
VGSSQTSEWQRQNDHWKSKAFLEFDNRFGKNRQIRTRIQKNAEILYIQSVRELGRTKVTISRKRKSPIVVDGREYLWWVLTDDEPPFVSSAGKSLKLVEASGEMFLAYPLGHPREVCHVVVIGKRFQSVVACGGPHRRFRCPVFAEGPTVTPTDVAAIICWAETSGEPMEVDYLGLPLAGNDRMEGRPN